MRFMADIDLDISVSRLDDHHICVYARDEHFIDLLENICMNGDDNE